MGSQTIKIICKCLIVVCLSLKGATMDYTWVRGIATSSSDHLAVGTIVSHLNQVVDVWVVAWCFVHVSTIQDLRQKSSDGVLFTDCPVE